METVLITGSNRGIGLEFVKQFLAKEKRVIACCRRFKQAMDLQDLAKNNNLLSIYELDVCDETQIAKVAKELSPKPIDILINNAGIYGERRVELGNIERSNFLKVMDVNCLGTLKVAEAFAPHVGKSQRKIMVTISSQMGSITDNSSGGSYAYRASKAALNAVMRSFALDVQNIGIKAMTLHPGWVKTDMGGHNALISAKQSVTGMIEQIDRYGADDHAEVFRRFDGKTIQW